MERTSNRQIYKKLFTQVPLLKNLVDTFETMFPYLSVDLVWLLRKSKEGDWFQGWHKDFLLGLRMTKTIVVNVGSKKRDNEETTRSFNTNVSFEVDDWKEIEGVVHANVGQHVTPHNPSLGLFCIIFYIR